MHYYITGELSLLRLSLPQWIDVLVVLSATDYVRYTISKIISLTRSSESKAGPVRPESMPSTLMGRIITPIHGLAIFLPPVVCATALAFNRFQPPEWMARFALSDDVLDETWRNAARVAACVGSWMLKRLTDSTFEHLGDQWHAIGRREHSRIVKTGPYAWVRHPCHSAVLLQQALWTVMFWSYIPLVGLGITAAAFIVKMPIEESLIEQDDAVRDEYRSYMKQVPARILPYVW